MLSAMLAALVAATVKATAILVLASFLTRLLARHAAAVRHLVWTLALGSAIALFTLPEILPAWRVIPRRADPVAVAPRTTAPTPTIVRETPTTDARGMHQRVEAASPVVPPIAPSPARWPDALLAAWLFGVVAVAIRCVAGRVALRTLALSTTEHSDMQRLVDDIARRMRIARVVRLRSSDAVELPLTWGVLEPQIVLPAHATEWTVERTRHVLEHELAHIRRLDAATQIVAQAASALFWFHPLVWYAVRKMHCERERACDDFVLTHGAIPSDYAGDLLALASAYALGERHTMALAFARRSHFEGRLLALLDPTVDRRTLSSRRIAIAVLLAAVFVVPVATLQRAEARTVPRASQHGMVAANLRTTAAAARPTTTQPVRAAIAPTVAPQPAPIAQRPIDDVFATCPLRMNGHDSDAESHGTDGPTWIASGYAAGCSFALESQGQIAFRRGLTGIESLSAGGHVSIATNINGEVTKLVVRSAPSGALDYELTRNGAQVVFDDTGAEWLAGFLVGLDRTNAFALDRRLPDLLEAGGPRAVFEEVVRMHSDFARLTYLRRLVETTRLDADVLRQLVELTAAVPTRHEVAELIIAIAHAYPHADAETRAGLLRAALALAPDHAQVRALLSIVETGPLQRDEAMAVQRAAMKMRAPDRDQVLRTIAAVAP